MINILIQRYRKQVGYKAGSENMLIYVCKRLLSIIPVVIGISIFAFFIGYLSPGDPARAALTRSEFVQEEISEELVEAKRKELGLDKPFLIQYTRWASQIVQGDFGRSMVDNRDIVTVFSQQLPCTIKLAVSSIVFSTILGILLGILAYSFYDCIIGKGLNFFISIIISVPGFWLSLILISLFSVRFHILPTSGYEGLSSLIMPVIVLSLSSIGTTARLMCASLLKERNQLYVVNLISKGLQEEYIVFHHMLKNAIIPIVTVSGNRLAGILGGAAIVESIFSLPGIGSYVLNAISNRDYYVVQAFVIYMGIIYVLISLITDMIYFAINPKMRGDWQ